MDKLSVAKSKLPIKLQSAGRAKSCTCCRQAKVACDARKTLTGQCSRCRIRQLDCRFDNNFKRVSIRRLVNALLSSTYSSILTETELQKKLVKSYKLCALATMFLMQSHLLWKQSHLLRSYRMRILQRLRSLPGAQLCYGLVLQIATQSVLTPWALLTLTLRLPLNYFNSMYCQPSIVIFC